MNEREKERALLVAAGRDRQIPELGRLAATLGIEVCGTIEQPRRDAAGYLGKGKREELALLVRESGAGYVITDDELTASQQRVLEKSAGVPVVDRTALIIQIFGAHARDAASRLEVELAELEYRLPRIRGTFSSMSRLGGSVGGGRIARGPGEQQLEYDRRLIRERIRTINRRLDEEETSRSVRRSRLDQGFQPQVALLGYTNAGKTTILNAMTGAERRAADRLFETLETTTRRVEGESREHDDRERRPPDFVVTDTVGFIRKLPTQLVRSFASTLEAAREADVHVICADASSPSVREEIETVEKTLESYLDGARNDARSILCLNKIDLLDEERKEDLATEYPEAVHVSAVSGDVLSLNQSITRAISEERTRIEILIPHSEYAEASDLYGMAEIHASHSTEQGVRFDVTLPDQALKRYSRYSIPSRA
jgi:GTP-binding protein HflX